MKKVPVLVFLVFIGWKSNAQYYYNDIILNQRLLSDMAAYKENKVKEIKVTSLEKDGTESEGFVCHKRFNRDFTKSELYTATMDSYATEFTSHFGKDGKLTYTVDSSEQSSTTAQYFYDDKGRLYRIYSVTHFSDEEAQDVFEDHVYTYNETDNPSKMLLIKNKIDTTIVLFMTDETGNVGIEKNGTTAEDYYYYYDNKRRVTEITHKYPNRTTVTTDYLFEYNNYGQLTKMQAAEQEGAYYFTWRYNYENGLRSMERCYSKEGSIQGSVEYQYKY